MLGLFYSKKNSWEYRGHYSNLFCSHGIIKSEQNWSMYNQYGAMLHSSCSFSTKFLLKVRTAKKNKKKKHPHC